MRLSLLQCEGKLHATDIVTEERNQVTLQGPAWVRDVLRPSTMQNASVAGQNSLGPRCVGMHCGMDLHSVSDAWRSSSRLSCEKCAAAPGSGGWWSDCCVPSMHRAARAALHPCPAHWPQAALSAKLILINHCLINV